MNSKPLHMLAYILLFVGGINWGLVGLGMLMGGTGYNLVGMLLGNGMLASIVYLLVGLSAVYVIATHKGDCKVCGK